METSILAATARLSRNSLVANVSPRNVHAGALVEPHCAGWVLGVDPEADLARAQLCEMPEHVLEQRDRQSATSVGGPDPQDVHPAQPRLALRLPAEGDGGHLVARLHEEPVRGLEILAQVPVGPRLERLLRESPSACEGVLVCFPRRPLVPLPEGT